MTQQYSEKDIKSLDWREHIRLRPGMYIGKLGDGREADDGIYVLLKEILDNSIDEFIMGAGKEVHISENQGILRVRDFGRGIPLGKLIDCVAQINTGGKYDSAAFKKSVGLNGVGTKAVNALSSEFRVQSFRDGRTKSARFSKGIIVEESKESATKEPNGTEVVFKPDEEIFGKFSFSDEYMEEMFWNYCFLNTKLKLIYRTKTFVSEKGLFDLLTRRIQQDPIEYPIIHLKGEDMEVAVTHGNQYGETYYSFVNGQFTTMGGTHQAAFREAFIKTIRDHYKKDFEAADIRSGIVASISVRIENPVFESQTKTKLGSQTISEGGASLKSWVLDFLKENLDNALHKNLETRQALLNKILQSERERKELAGIKKLANERAKKANLFNKKLRDCRITLDSSNPAKFQSTLFITEGDSASGSLTKARDVQTQAVFSLRGKPLNCFGLTKKIVYENEEFNLLQHALNIENSLEELRYNKVVIATDADVDGMHIRLLLMTFFLQFFPELVRQHHVFILQTPLFRVRDKKNTVYCYSEEEKEKSFKLFGAKPEITRFKGLGEISPDEFKAFIGKDIRLDPVLLSHKVSVQEMLGYYMGKNTPERQVFIMEHLYAVVE